MKTIYLDIFSGISGDMFIGAMIDLGVEFEALERELGKLELDEYHLHVARASRSEIAGIKFDVHLAHDHDHDHPEGHGHDHHQHHERHRGGPDEASSSSTDHHHHHDHHHGPEQAESGTGHGHTHSDTATSGHEHRAEATGHDLHHGRTFADIRGLIGRSGLSDWVKERATAVFRRIAEAEGRIHGELMEAVHFHEVGAVDSIVDIVGACVALELLGRPRLMAAPVVEGTGFIQCAHGRFPIPAPATLEILAARGVGITQCEEPHELVTPTGAALLAELVEEFGPMRDLRPIRVGYGLGTRENRTRPNVLRAVLADTSSAGTPGSDNDWERDVVMVLETNLDDIPGEVLGGFVDQALRAGALDVFHTPVHMKKNRPGVLLTVLCGEAEADRFSELILRETSAFGVRRHRAERRKLRRESVQVETSHGPVAVKLGRLNGQVVQASPEYESCRQLALRAGVPLKAIYEAAIRAVHILSP